MLNFVAFSKEYLQRLDGYPRVLTVILNVVQTVLTHEH